MDSWPEVAVNVPPDPFDGSGKPEGWLDAQLNKEGMVRLMCGITGFSLTKESCVNGRELMRTLLKGIESRGREATGFAFFTSKGNIIGDALPMPASKYIKTKRMRLLDAEARTAIGHTRLATQGSPKFRQNNHPVFAYADNGEAVAAVHNGSVWNDDDPFRDFGLPRYGQVDSEAIPALIAKFGSSAYAYIFKYLEGGIATSWLDEREPNTLHCVRAWDSPMVLAAIDVTTRIGPIKGVIFASNVTTLTDGLSVLGLSWATEGVKQYEIAEGEAFTVVNGEWSGLVYPFELPESLSQWSKYAGYSHRWEDGDEDYHWSATSTKAVTKGDPTEDEDDYATALNRFAGSEDRDDEDPRESSGRTSLHDDGDMDDFASANAAILSELDRVDGVIARLATPAEKEAWADAESDYIDWWLKTDGDRILREIVSEAKDPSWRPSIIDCSVISQASDEAMEAAGMTRAFVADLVTDVTIHNRFCNESHCVFDMSLMCPASDQDGEPIDVRVNPTALTTKPQAGNPHRAMS